MIGETPCDGAYLLSSSSTMKSNGRAFEPFTIRYRNGKGPESLKADAVIDALERTQKFLEQWVLQ